MADAPDIMTANKATSWAQRSQRTFRAGRSRELRRESHQFRSDLSQDLQTPNLTNPAPNRGPRALKSRQFWPYNTVGLEAVQRSNANAVRSFSAKTDASGRLVGAFPALKREQHMGFGGGVPNCVR